jgi:glycosyltransferase involved in cell wall biosynthesis
VPAERARTISYGVDSLSPDAFSTRNAQHKNDRLRVAYVGRVVEEQKRVSRMLPVCAELRRRKVDFELHIIGDGPARASLQEKFTSSGLDDNVRFHGWCSPAEVKQLLSEMDVFLLLSDYEGLPVALLEAMGYGVVPVVTRIASGNSEVIREGTNGFFVHAGDFEDCAQRLELLARDKQRVTEMSAEAWKTAQAYTITRMAEKYLDTFGELMRQVVPRAPRPPNPANYPLMPSCVSRYPQWLRKMKRRFVALPKKSISF